VDWKHSGWVWKVRHKKPLPREKKIMKKLGIVAQDGKQVLQGLCGSGGRHASGSSSHLAARCGSMTGLG
jgi:hypothetical protein